ncbi:MAG: hypothetical protein JNM93_08055 [Bacteriovoracaceae bacterium]|nr:hypothetical protein [Bacteriovoracaceae bacterium]
MKNVLLIGLLLLSMQVHADPPDFTSLSASDLKKVLTDFNGNMTPTTVTGSSSAKIFGFQVGLVASTIDSPNIKTLDSNVDKIANASIYANLALPLGIGFEALYTPLKLDDMEYNYKSILAYYSGGMGFLNYKVKGFVTTASMEYTDPTSGAVEYESKNYGANLVFGLPLIVIEPYAGVGYVSGDSKLNAAVSLFDGAVTQAMGASGVDEDDVYVMAGLEANLLFIKLGAEYSNPYGNDRIAARVSLGF